jgi:Na+-transporting methylmalonyl-CoA/oxaloacetate decarboxylase gamma subunit
MTDFLLSLQITALGMGLVFGAILLLWLMMVLLTLFTAEKESASDAPEPAPVSETGFKAQASALAEQGQSTARPLAEPPTAIVSAWQLGMRTRQMSEKGSSRKR